MPPSASRLRLAVIAVVATAAGLATACLESPAVTCADGRLCPENTVCDEVHASCVLPGQLTTCLGSADGEPCEIGGSAGGICKDAVCVRAGCGDGFRRETEECDGTDLGMAIDCTDRDYHSPGVLSCAADCTFELSGCEGICGDGMQDPSEDCDLQDLGASTDCQDLGYYDSSPVSCSSFCVYKVDQCTGYCGDSMVNGDEYCEPEITADSYCVDFGMNAGILSCNDACGPDLGACAIFGFKSAPSPTGENLFSVWGSSSTDIYAVGDAGMVLHFDGSGWSTMTSPTSEDLRVVVGTGPKDVWIGGTNGALFHYDGTDWEALDSESTGRIRSIWPTGDGGLYIANGSLRYHNGTEWSVPALARLGNGAEAVWGSAPDDVWMLTTNWLEHYDGAIWSVVNVPVSPDSLVTLHGRSADDIWLLGRLGTLIHYDGVAWTQIDRGGGDTIAFDLWASSPRDVYVAGYSSVSSRGKIIHYNGTSVTDLPASTSSYMRAIWGSGPDALVAAGDAGTLRRSSGVSLRPHPTPQFPVSTTRVRLIDLWGASESELFGLTLDGALVSFDGDSWTDVAAEFASGQFMSGLWGASADELYATGGSGVLLHYDGNQWNELSSGVSQGLADIWGTGPRNIYAVGGTDVLHYTGGTWPVVHSVASDALSSIWGSGPDDIYAAGTAGAIHWNGSSWAPVAIGTSAAMTDIRGTGPDDVWMVGADGEVAHWDGTSWTSDSVPGHGDLSEVWPIAADDVFAGGKNGVLFHFDGKDWAPVSTLSPEKIGAMWGSPRGLVYAGNEFGDHLVRTVPWRCDALEAHCGDGADNDCDGMIDLEDSDCAASIQLTELHGGATDYIEITNQVSRRSSLAGISLAYRLGCDTEVVHYTFGSDANLSPDERIRLVDTPDDVGEREYWSPTNLCQTPGLHAWVALCAGPCDLGSCANMLDYLELTDGSRAPSAPACATFAGGALDVSSEPGSGPSANSATRVGFTGSGANAQASDWALAPATRD